MNDGTNPEIRTDYAGRFVYNNDELEYFLMEEGRMVEVEGIPGQYRPEYFLCDHLGDVRVVFSDTDEDGTPEILQENHYYPFGLTMGSLNYVNNTENKLKYNGKELDDENNLRWYDYGFRRYDPQLGRWHVMDALSEKYINLSPYAYVANNPFRFIDQLGLSIDDPFGGEGGAGPTGNWFGKNTYQPSVSADLGGVNYGGGSSFSYNVPDVEDVLEYKRQVVNKITKLTFHQWYSGGGRANMTIPEGGELVIHEGELGVWVKSHTATGETVYIRKIGYVGGEYNLINKWVPAIDGASSSEVYITGEWQKEPYATISSVEEGDSRFKIRLNPGGKIGIGLIEIDYYVTGTVRAEILAKRYVNGNLVEQKIITHQIDLTKRITVGFGLTLRPLNWYNTGRTIIDAPDNITNGIQYYNQFKGALETIGGNQIIPNIVAKGAFYY